MKEADLYAEMVAGMLLDGFVAYRIQDGSVGKKPFDIGGIALEGMALACEVKAPKTAEAVSLSWAPFERHQCQWLRAFAGAGALALACVYDRQTGVMLVWSLRHANDRCERPCDARIVRAAGSFRGWSEVAAERLSSLRRIERALGL